MSEGGRRWVRAFVDYAGLAFFLVGIVFFWRAENKYGRG